MNKALVTMAVGRPYADFFPKHCQALWQQYAERHGYDLIVLSDFLDNSERARARSPAWQKCLILSEPTVRDYDRVVWIDSDILINPKAPDIGAEVPEEMVGGVNEFLSPSADLHVSCLESLYASFDERGAAYSRDLSPSQYYQSFGLEGEFDALLQTGVLVLSPKHHRAILEHVYHNYEGRPEAYWHYEMRPLGYELMRANKVHWISPRFNAIWLYLKHAHYPFLLSKKQLRLEKQRRKLKFLPASTVARRCATAAFLGNYFLHFAGSSKEMYYVDVPWYQRRYGP